MEENSLKKSGNSFTLVLLVIVLLGALGGGYLYFQSKTTSGRPTEEDRTMAPEESQRPAGGINMMTSTPPPVSEQQTLQLAAGIDTSSKKKTFNVTGGSFYFVPNKITVNEGDEVTIVVANAGGTHNLIIDEFGAKTPTVAGGKVATVTFTADKSGSFVYYCDLPRHREKGMWGTLIVQ